MESVSTPGKMTFVTLKLKSNWLGHPKGSTVTVNSFAAQSILDRKGATLVGVKALENPKKDKMLTAPERKKRA